MNLFDINGYKAIIHFDSELQLFRGEFVGLSGEADFYAADIEGLQREGEVSLKVFLDLCEEKGIPPRKQFSGKFNVRLPTRLHEEITQAAAAGGKSLNQWVSETLSRELRRTPG